MKVVMKIISIIFFWGIIRYMFSIFRSYKSSRVNITLLNKLAELTYPKHFDKFETYFGLYLNDKENFISKYELILKDYNIDFSKSLTPLQILFVFGVSINAIYVYDTRKKTYKFEPEHFIENLLHENIKWITASKWREMNSLDKQNTFHFQINLLQTIDNDIQLIHKKILFFSEEIIYLCSDIDNYSSDIDEFSSDIDEFSSEKSFLAFTIVEESGFSEIIDLEPNIFHGI